jgi:transcription initiation factor TFIID subunit 13
MLGGVTTARKHYFLKELRVLMYGFGDDKQPYQETVSMNGQGKHNLQVELLEQMVVDYIRSMTQQCLQVGKPGKIGLEDIWYLTRRDPRKFARVKDLLNMSDELKRARRAFDESKFGVDKNSAK